MKIRILTRIPSGYRPLEDFVDGATASFAENMPVLPPRISPAIESGERDFT